MSHELLRNAGRFMLKIIKISRECYIGKHNLFVYLSYLFARYPQRNTLKYLSQGGKGHIFLLLVGWIRG